MPVDFSPKLPTTGTEVRLTMLVGGQPINESRMRWMGGNLSEDAQIYNDKYMGRLRDRFDKKVVSFSASAEFDVADFAIVEGLRSMQQQVESYQPIDELTFMFEHVQRDATFDQFMLLRCQAKWSLSMSDKDSRNRLSIQINAEDLAFI